MNLYSPISQHQIGYPQVGHCANALVISGFATTILGEDTMEIGDDIFGDRDNLEPCERSAKQGGYLREFLASSSRFTSSSRVINAIHSETYPSGRCRNIAVPT
ncbi:hypothetical protein [Pseudanabaena sp. 'Roaring Creek']|uniref:hypothetical protein n=1 Tax=Pseudanabaena sp. 'Roaring Creek' TaxID=1681830 RepID=UPI0006D7A371|nr:hypothetical protein [Pseudanabaena sp. 'Roaring Creek']